MKNLNQWLSKNHDDATCEKQLECMKCFAPGAQQRTESERGRMCAAAVLHIRHWGMLLNTNMSSPAPTMITCTQRHLPPFFLRLWGFIFHLIGLTTASVRQRWSSSCTWWRTAGFGVLVKRPLTEAKMKHVLLPSQFNRDTPTAHWDML